MERYIFYSIALIMIVAAIASVVSKKMLRSVIYLLFVLIGAAGIYFLIDYNFLAAIQLTIYAGGIIVLIIFSVFLVHHIEMKLEMAKLSRKIIVGIACIVGLGLFFACRCIEPKAVFLKDSDFYFGLFGCLIQYHNRRCSCDHCAIIIHPDLRIDIACEDTEENQNHIQKTSR